MRIVPSSILVLCCIVTVQDMPDSIKGGPSQDSILAEKLKNLELVTEPHGFVGSTEIPIVQYYMLDVRPRILNYPKSISEQIRSIDREYNPVVRMLIDSDGSVIDSEVTRSSGNAQLDSIVLDAFLDCKFTPPKYKGRCVRTWVSVPYGFDRKE